MRMRISGKTVHEKEIADINGFFKQDAYAGAISGKNDLRVIIKIMKK